MIFPNEFFAADTSPDYVQQLSQSKKKYSGSLSAPDKLNSRLNKKRIGKESERHEEYQNGQMSTSPRRSRRLQTLSKPSSSADEVDDEIYVIPDNRQANAGGQKISVDKSHAKNAGLSQDTTSGGRTPRSMRESIIKVIHLILRVIFQ